MIASKHTVDELEVQSTHTDAQLVQDLVALVRKTPSLEQDTVIYQILSTLKYNELHEPVLTARQRRSARRALERFTSATAAAPSPVSEFRFVTKYVTVTCSALHGWVVGERVSEPFPLVRLYTDAPWAQPGDHQVLIMVEALPPNVTLTEYVNRCSEMVCTAVPLARTHLTPPEPIFMGGMPGLRVYYEQHVPMSEPQQIEPPPESTRKGTVAPSTAPSIEDGPEAVRAHLAKQSPQMSDLLSKMSGAGLFGEADGMLSWTYGDSPDLRPASHAPQTSELSSGENILSVTVDTCMCVLGSAAVTLQYVSLTHSNTLRPSFHSLVADTIVTPTVVPANDDSTGDAAALRTPIVPPDIGPSPS